MTEKVKLTREQAEFIKAYEKNVASYNGWEEDLLYQHAEQWGKSFKDAKQESQCMRTISPMNMAKILLFGYEVEEEKYKVGNMVRYWRTDCAASIGRITYVNYDKGLAQFDNCTVTKSINDIARLATPEEISKEKERRMWEKMGRKTGEFLIGDIAVTDNGVYVDDIPLIRHMYQNQKARGFYPAESFISFNK